MVSLNNTTTVHTNGSDDHGMEQFEESTGLYAFRLVLFLLIMLASLIGNRVLLVRVLPVLVLLVCILPVRVLLVQPSPVQSSPVDQIQYAE